MARALTSPELTLLRSDTQFSKLYLAVHKPNTIYTALLNGVPTSNDQVYQVTFDTAVGTLSDVKANMTLLVGTSAGGSELGIARIRKDPIAGTFYIGLTSEIEWADNAYLTVVDDFDLWPKHATIADEALSMDVDIAYSDQHTVVNPVPILGPHAVVWLEETPAATELITNGTFTTDTSGWSKDPSGVILSVVSARLNINRNSAALGNHAYQDITTEIGTAYVLSVDINTSPTTYQILADNVVLFSGTGTGTKVYTFIATATTTRIAFIVTSPVTGQLRIDNVSVKEAGAVAQFDSSDSWVFDSTISAYLWSAPGAYTTGMLTTATPVITYNATGIYRVYCTVTSADGKTTTGVRHVFVYDRGENGPSTVFQLAQCNADYDGGGWMFDMEMEAEASLTDIRDRALVVLFAEDWYGTTKQSIGPVENRENIVCVGRVVGQSIRWDRETGRVHFTVQGAHYWLGKIKAFPVEMIFATNTPDSWSVMPDMTVDRFLWHVLYWHSTAIETMDFYPTNDTRFLPEGKSLASTIWGQLLDVAQSRLLANAGVDRFGRLFIEIDPQMTPEADRDWATVMALTDDDWQEGIDIQRVTVDDTSLITLTSQQCDESGAVITLYSLSPGHVPLRHGEPMPIDRLLAASQTESNSLAGLALGWHTNPFPEIPIIMAMNNRMIDLWPRQFCGLTMAEADTPREVAFDGNLIPRRASFYFDGDTGWMHSEYNFEAETFEKVNTDGDIPDVEDTSIPPFPHINFPDLPPLDPIFPGDVSQAPDGPPVVILVDRNLGLLRTQNFNSDSPTWQFWNTGIDAVDRPLINDNKESNHTGVWVTPSGGVYVSIWEATFDRWMDGLYYAPVIGGTFTKIIDQDWLDANEGASGKILGIGCNYTKANEIGLVLGTGNTTKHFWLGNNLGFTQKVLCSHNTNFMGGMTFGGNKWVWDLQTASNEYWRRFSADGSSLEYTSTSFGQGGLFWTVRAGTSATILKYKPGVTGLEGILRSTDNGDTWDEINLAPVVMDGRIAVAYDGLYMFGAWDTSARRGRSSDGGYTWDGSFFTYGDYYCYAYAGGAGAASKWILGRGSVRYSPDFGTTWIAKEGNLPYIIPINMSIRKIIVPGI
jgi:hypothetical protein